MALSALLRESTMADHEYAESRPFITELMAGRLHVRAYVDLLAGLTPVYQAMEQHFHLRSDESSMCLFDHRALDRFGRMSDDLASFGQPALRADTLTSTHNYVTSIHRASESPQRLLAHHYTRYLGDMAGGRAIAAVLHRSYGVSLSQLSFYDFTDVGDIVHYRRRYKQLLDLVPWSEHERRIFINEARLAFRLNADLFDELADIHGIEPQSWSPSRFFASERGHIRHLSQTS